MAGTEIGSPLVPDERERVRTIAAEWSAGRGCPHPVSMRVVATTLAAAMKAQHGPRVSAFPDDAIYLVVVDGIFASADQRAYLVIKPHLNRVSTFVLRPADGAPDVQALGQLHELLGMQ